MRVENDQLDLFRFEQLVQQAQDAPPAVAASLLREALGLWRGPPLADLAPAPFAELEVARLEELRLLAIERRLETDVALGRHADVAAELEGLVAPYPLREALRALLMRALYLSGRQADALEAYRDARCLLVSELGIEPSPALQALEQAILRHDPSLDPTASAVRISATSDRRIVVLCRDERRVDDLLAIAEPLARSSHGELILSSLARGRRFARCDRWSSGASPRAGQSEVSQRGWPSIRATSLALKQPQWRPSTTPISCSSTAKTSC